MILLITKLQRGTNKAQTGKVYEGLYLAGWKQSQDAAPEMYEKFLYDWKDAAHIQELEQIGKDAAALIKMVRNGRFWDIESIEEWNGGGVIAGDPNAVPEGNNNNAYPKQYQQKEQAAANAQSEATKTSPHTATEAVGKAFIAQSMTSDQTIRCAALQMSVDMVRNMLSSDPRFKKVLLVSTTSDLLGEILINYAQSIESFIKVGPKPIKSDAKDLKGAPESKDSEIGQDENPYAGGGQIEDEDIPF